MVSLLVSFEAGDGTGPRYDASNHKLVKIVDVAIDVHRQISLLLPERNSFSSLNQEMPILTVRFISGLIKRGFAFHKSWPIGLPSFLLEVLSVCHSSPFLCL